MRRAAIVSLVLAAALPVLASCGSTSNDDATKQEPTTEPTLSLGDSHTWTTTDESGAKVRYVTTVDAVVQGSPADLKGLRNASEYVGKTPWYLDYSETGLDNDLRPGIQMRLVAADGTEGTRLVVLIGGKGHCADLALTADQPAQGVPMRLCSTFLLPTGIAPVRVATGASDDDTTVNWAVD